MDPNRPPYLINSTIIKLLFIILSASPLLFVPWPAQPRFARSSDSPRLLAPELRSQTSQASPAATEPALRLDDLIKLALERNPDLRSLSARLEAEKFRIPIEKSLPDPVFSFSLKNMGLDSFSVGKEEMSGLGFSLAQMFPFPGKLRLKGEIAATRALRSKQLLKAGTLTLVRRIKELYSRLFYYQEAIDILQAKAGVLKKALAATETRYSVGTGIQSDIFKARVEISRIEEMLIPMHQMVDSIKGEINSLLDLPLQNPLGRPQELDFSGLQVKLEDLISHAEQNSPTLKEAELMIEENSREVALARKEIYPNFMIQVGKEFKGHFKDMYEVMVGVEIPLYLKSKQKNMLRESISSLSGARTDYVSMKNDLSSIINENFLMAKTADNLIRLYKEKIIPQASLALDSSLSNYSVGRVDFLTLLSDIDNFFSYRMEYFNQVSQFWIACAKLEELTASAIFTEGGD